MRSLRDYQRECIAYLFKAWGAGITRPPAVLATGLGKGHPLDTDVPTPDGLRKWGDLRPGDRVFGRDGLPVSVTAVFDRGVLPTYRVTFSDRSSVRVDGEHLWRVRDAERKGRLNEKSYRRLNTTEIMALGLRPKNDRGWRWHVPMTAVWRARRDLPLDPYVVGALIANGCLTGRSGVQLTTPDPNVAKLVGIATDCRKVNDATPGVCDRYYLPGIDEVTQALGMRVRSVEKRIPRVYLESAQDQRIGLLHGLMDADGSSRDQTRRSVTYHTTSPGLAYDVCELVTSLGGTASVREYERTREGKPTEYQVGILLPSGIPAFATTRKAHGEWSMRNLQPKRAIVSIERVHDAEIRCITVDAPDHLYLITRSHIVTHNTEIFTDPSLLDEFLDAGRRVLIIAHTDELIDQAARKARRNNPKRRVGIVKATQNEVHAQIIVSSRQTLGHATGGPRRLAALRNVGLIIIDEAHHAVRTNTYGKILEHFGAFDEAPARCEHPYGTPCEECFNSGVLEPDMRPKVAGFTATLARGDKAKLSTVWQEPPREMGGIFRRDILFGIRRGFLLDVRGERVVVPDLDMRNVRQAAGDYRDSDIAEELERTFAPEKVAEAYAQKCAVTLPDGEVTFRKGIAFWPLVETAYHGEKAFNEAGIRSETIHGELPKAERRAILARLHSGETRVVHGVGVLTEGFDEPTADVVVIARPTRSAPLYQQMVGRVLRPNLELPPEQRGRALILDVVGVGAAHDLRSLIDLAPERPLNPDLQLEQSLLELDETLLEVEEARAGAGIELEDPEYAGEIEIREFDPLGRDKLWQRTPGGAWFMKAGGVGFAFVTPSVAGEPAHWDVVLCSKLSYPRGGVQPWLKAPGHVDLPLDMALGWAEEEAIELGGVGSKTLAGRKSAWRKAPPKPGAERYARSLDVWRDGMTGGECSDAIDLKMAADRIDPLVLQVRAAYSE